MDKEVAKRVWGASPAGASHGGLFEPGSKEYFDSVLLTRNSYEVPWLRILIPFAQFHGKRVLEIGCGAGYDAYEMMRSGAIYSGIDITPENIQRTRAHLKHYGYIPDVEEGDGENLRHDSGSFDVVYSNGVLHHTPDIVKSFQEAHRVLKTHGEFWLIVYHKNSIFYWITLLVVDHILRLGFSRMDFNTRLSRIEYTTSNSLPIVNVYTKKQLRQLLECVGFNVEEIWVRKLVKEDMPAIPLISII